MNRLCQIFLIACCIATSSLLAQTGNVLDGYNGDFESGMVQWRFFEVPTSLGSTAEVITTGVAHGTKAIKVTYVSPSADLVDRGFDNWDSNVPVQGGSSYTASVQAKTDNPGTQQVRITLGFFDGNRVVLTEKSQAYTLTSSYQAYTVQMNAPSDAEYCWIAFRLVQTPGGYVAGTMYLDDAQLIGAPGPPPPAFVPKVMTTTLQSDDIPIASIDITEAPYSAAKDGSSDVTDVFQAAIDYTASRGGGVVFAPAGTYRFDGTLTMKEKVTLRGEWQNPDSGGAGKGTILMVESGSGDELGTPFISINRGSGIRNLTIWYPNQSVAPVPYPWTILCNPNTAAGTGDNTSVINVTLVNPYQAIKIGPASNELHYIRNVYGSPLKTGIWLSQTTDIGRIMNLHFAPQYWALSTLSGSPTASAIESWTQANAEAISMGRSDWEYMYDINLVGYKTGIRIFQYDPTGPAANGVIYGLHTDGGHIGIRFENVNPYGFAITGSTINVSAGSNPVCVEAANSFSTVAQFNSCTFGGSPTNAVSFEDNCPARMTFQNCIFAQWGDQDNDPAIKVVKGSIAVIGSNFGQDKMQVFLGDGVANAQILDNVYPSRLKMVNLSAGEVEVSNEKLDLPKLAAPPHPFGVWRKPATNQLFVVTDYGAVGDKTTDDTPAFQAALDAAGTAGGGTVYVPAGWYKIASHLNIPQGVELRGIWDVPHHTVSQGTVLLASEGSGNPDGTPFIVLQQGSGVRGLTVWYPGQNYTQYPWTIQARGADCWVEDVTLGNPYQGVDFATYPSLNHFISYLAGCPLKTGIYVSNNTGEGWIENVQFNSHYWKRSSGYPTTATPDLNGLTPYQQLNLDAIKVGSCVFEHQLGNFVFAAARGLYFVNDGGSCTSDVFLHGTDAGACGIAVESPSGSNINLVNSQLVLTASTPQGYFSTGSSFAGTVLLANTLEWGNSSGLSADIQGTGTVGLQQINTLANKVNLAGGTVRVDGVSMKDQFSPQFTIGSGLSAAGIYGNYNPSGFAMTGTTAGTVEADYNYKQIARTFVFSTGWETADRQNDWNNTMYSSANVAPSDGESALLCLATDGASGHVLKVSAKATSAVASNAFFKVFKVEIPIYTGSVLSYAFMPETELGRTVHVDLLLDDGSRLSEHNAIASDGESLNFTRGSVGAWTTVRCPVGTAVASGHSVREILVGFDGVGSTGDVTAFLDSLTISVVPNIESPWDDANVGGAANPGMSMTQENSYELIAGGTGLRYGGDNFYFLYQPWNGNVVITARLDGISRLTGASFAGVMIRQSAETTGSLVMVGLYPQTGLQTMVRRTPVSSVEQTLHDQYDKATPRWVRIIRSGNVFTTMTSADGDVWTDTLTTATVTMDSSVLVGMALGAGSSNETADARFSRVAVTPEVPTGVQTGGIEKLPRQFQLYQNYPNPFNPSTTIRFDLATADVVSLKVYDLLGREIATLFQGPARAGTFRVLWDGRMESGQGVSSGVYICRLVTSHRQFSNKMLLLR